MNQDGKEKEGFNQTNDDNKDIDEVAMQIKEVLNDYEKLKKELATLKRLIKKYIIKKADH